MQERYQPVAVRNTRSQLSAGAQVILQPMTVEQRELMITGLWCCRPAADAGMIKETLFLIAKILGEFYFVKKRQIA